MHCPTTCPCDQTAISLHSPIVPSSANFTTPSQNSRKELLKIARQIAQGSQPGEWERFRLEQYFGVESRSLPFRERLLPIVWAARQLLINRVGARYCRLALPKRAQIEFSLLVQLNITLEATCQSDSKPEFFGHPIAHDVAFEMALSGLFVQASPMLSEIIAIASYWVDSVEEFLDIL